MRHVRKQLSLRTSPHSPARRSPPKHANESNKNSPAKTVDSAPRVLPGSCFEQITVGAALRGRPCVIRGKGAAAEGRPYSCLSRAKSYVRFCNLIRQTVL